ncbi:MAG: (d)CMP kinase, partial [Deltaproteobacteria bacterium]|nr:(d)CMP kinase [Deltaproteobacteria bacterium]
MSHIITIDGPTGSGKSTVSRLLAKRLNYPYLDTGAMYRVVGLAIQRAGIELENEKEV